MNNTPRTAFDRIEHLPAGSLFQVNYARYLRTQDGVLNLSEWTSRADSTSLASEWIGLDDWRVTVYYRA